MLKRLFFCLLILACSSFFFQSVALAQSKTEKSKRALDGTNRDSKSEPSPNSGSDDNDDEQNFVGWLFSQLIGDLFSFLFYSDTYSTAEAYAYYNPYPYFPSANPYGFKSSGGFKTTAFQFDADITPGSQTDANLAFHSKVHLSYWAIDGSFRRYSEQGAPYNLYQYHAGIERKMRFFPRTEAGVQLGYQGFSMQGDRYHGAYLGFVSDYYFFQPLSFTFNYSGTIIGSKNGQEYIQSSTLQTGARLHFSRCAIGTYYQRLSLDGITFSSMNIGFGVYF